MDMGKWLSEKENDFPDFTRKIPLVESTEMCYDTSVGKFMRRYGSSVER